MPKREDKRRRSDLDLFILALVDGGLVTSYELQKSAGLSQGATIPALQRLLDAGLLLQGKPGVRGRTDYRISAAGRRLLKDGWVSLLDEGPSGDADADLRVALLTIAGGGDRGQAVDFLRSSAARKLESATIPGTDSDSPTTAPLARWYSELRSQAGRAVLAAESKAIAAMAEMLPSVPSSSPKRTRPNKKQKRT